MENQPNAKESGKSNGNSADVRLSRVLVDSTLIFSGRCVCVCVCSTYLHKKCGC